MDYTPDIYLATDESATSELRWYWVSKTERRLQQKWKGRRDLEPFEEWRDVPNVSEGT
ncbi:MULTISPECIES: hypothetical protein [unclassified Phaeobacter]|uniref:hypothetical protein n=1 Tax=unclassified Phaeobacter TaxID=2621772 RepID=UPI003A8ABCCD